MKVIVHTSHDITTGERQWRVFKKGNENSGTPNFIVTTSADHKGELGFLKWARENKLKIVRTITKSVDTPSATNAGLNPS